MTGLHRCSQCGEPAVHVVADIGQRTTDEISNVLIRPPVHVNQHNGGALSERQLRQHHVERRGRAPRPPRPTRLGATQDAAIDGTDAHDSSRPGRGSRLDCRGPELGPSSPRHRRSHLRRDRWPSRRRGARPAPGATAARPVQRRARTPHGDLGSLANAPHPTKATTPRIVSPFISSSRRMLVDRRWARLVRTQGCRTGTSPSPTPNAQ